MCCITSDSFVNNPPMLSRGSMTALVLLAGLSALAGLWPEPLMALARTAADGLLAPAAYITSVFPGGAP